MTRIFISHSSSDNASATAVRDFLVTSGFDELFLDLDPERGIAGGERWERALNEAVNRCEAVLFLVSKGWLASDWCLREFHLATKLNKHILGVLIEQVPLEALPRDLTSTWQFVDLASGQDHVILRVTDPSNSGETHVTFSRDGLTRLRLGLAKVGLDPRFFAWPPGDQPDREPYRGLKPMEAEDAGIFFGREAPIVATLDRLRGLREAAAPRLFVIIGASGAGKSSFLRAGLLPRLGRSDRYFLPLPVIRPEGAAISGENGLLRSLERAHAAHGVARSRADLRAAISADGTLILRILDDLAQHAQLPALPGETGHRPPTFVLPIDQAEELFLAEGAEEAERLLHVLRVLANAHAPDTIVLFTIRSDAYERLQAAKALEGLAQDVFSLPPLPQGSYQMVIEGPAARLERVDRPLKIEPALTQALLADIEAGGSKDALPLLAFTLQRLYAEHGGDGDLRLDEYRALGGVVGSIEAAVKRALVAAVRDGAVPRDEAAQLGLLRRALIPWLAGIDPETGAPRRRVARLSEIPEETRPLVQHLVDARLLSTDLDPATNERTVEPAHEALLRQWGLLEGWLKEDVVALTTLEGVRRAATEWLANACIPDWLAHAAGRLEDAERLRQRPDLSGLLSPQCWDYLAACREAEDARRDFRLLEAQRLAEEQRKAAEAQRLVVRRTRLGLIAASTLAAVALGAAFFGTVQWRNATRREAQMVEEAQRADKETRHAHQQAVLAEEQRKKATEETERAEASTRAARDRLRQAQVNQARYVASQAEYLADKLPEIARLALLRVLPDELSEEAFPLVREAVAAMASVHEKDRVKLLLPHNGYVEDISFSHDGKRLITRSTADNARIWDAETGALLKVIGKQGDDVILAAFMGASRRIATLNGKGIFCIFDGESDTITTSLGVDGVIKATISRDGRLLATEDRYGTVTIRNITDSSIPFTYIQGQHVSLMNFSPDGASLLILTNNDNTPRLYDTLGRSHRVDLGTHPDVVSDAAFSPDGLSVATSSRDGSVRVWNATTGAALTTFEVDRYGLTSVAFSADGKLIGTGSHFRNGLIFDAETGEPVDQLFTPAQPKFHIKYVLDKITFSPDGFHFAAIENDSAVTIWRLGTQTPFREIDIGEPAFIKAIAYSPDGNNIAIARRSDIYVFDLKFKRIISILKGHKNPISSISFSKNGQFILSSSWDNTIKLWSLSDGLAFRTFVGHEDHVLSAAFNRDGSQIVSASKDETVRIWDTDEEREVRKLQGHRNFVFDAKFIKNGSGVVSVSADGRLIVWDTDTGSQIFISNTKSILYSLDIDRDEKIAVVGEHGSANLFYLDDYKWKGSLNILSGERVSTRGVFSPEGRRILIGDFMHSSAIYDTVTGALLKTLRYGPVNALVAFGPDGHEIALVDHSIAFYNVDDALPAETLIKRERLTPFWWATPDDMGLFYPPDDSAYANSGSELESCDALAKHPFDPSDRTKAGVEFEAIDGKAALDRCWEIIRARPEETRFQYQYARALSRLDKGKEALEALKNAADRGYPMALYALGIKYRYGENIPKDPKQARALLDRALAAGVTIAAGELGRIAWAGEGQEAPDIPTAVAVWRRGAAMGDPFSHERLAWVAEAGRDGKAQDLESALFHYAVASQLLDAAGVYRAEDAMWIRARRGSLARTLDPQIVADLWPKVRDWKPEPIDAGLDRH